MKRAVAAIVGLSVGFGVLSLADARVATSAWPSYEVPNTPGSLTLPERGVSTPPVAPERRSLAELERLWREAGAAYGIPWPLLGAINSVESNMGQNMGPSYAGAVGWMQFLPSTWDRWGLDADGDGVADPWDPDDAVYGAARYLAAADAHEDLRRAVYAYNHSYAYVDRVMSLAADIGGGQAALRAVAPAPSAGGAGVVQVDSLIDRVEEARADAEALEGDLRRAEQRLDVLRSQRSRLVRRAAIAAAGSSDARFARIDAERALVDRQLEEMSDEAGAYGAAYSNARERLGRRLVELAGGPEDIPADGVPVDLGGDRPRLIGTPGVGTHNQSDWQSRNAVDIAALPGTAVLATETGVITRVSGSDPDHGTRSTATGKKIYGYSITLETASGRYFYAHVDDVVVSEGQTVTGGQRLASIANWGGGPAHLHFATETGHPADLLGAGPPQGGLFTVEDDDDLISFSADEAGQ
jgi:murein DD-endopeptidase MepM/ murein hydrolase activator NlpD